uniref:PUM-HD domain-containing protein n=1 Tax=Timema tahoe TaxID=61484 RepID=A0A7R9NZZ0_9NEOP|nr:unnamed protein product [Timema tahoe]
MVANMNEDETNSSKESLKKKIKYEKPSLNVNSRASPLNKEKLSKKVDEENEDEVVIETKKSVVKKVGKFEKQSSLSNKLNISEKAGQNNEVEGIIKSKKNMTKKLTNFEKLTNEEIAAVLESKKATSSRPSNGQFSQNKTKVVAKPNWAKLKEEKKKLKLHRKKERYSIFERTIQAKKLWEKVRLSKCPLTERETLISEMYDLLKDHMVEVVHSHDMGRVIQWLLKLGSEKIRDRITEELKQSLVELIQLKYAHFCVKRMLKYGSKKSQQCVIQSFYGNVVKLMRHKLAAPVVELAYSTWATNEQKAALRQEFYGSMYKVDKDPKIHSLANVFESLPDFKTSTLETTKSNIMKVLDKKSSTSSLMHTVIFDYLNHCSKEDRMTMLEQLRGSILELLTTKEGAHIAVMCLRDGSNKDRKLCVKSLKSHVKDIAKSEHGHLVLLAMFDCIDDTVLLKKALFPELVSNITEIAADGHGRRVILYLVAHRDSHYFHPAGLGILKQGDETEFSKKDANVRRAELLNGISDDLLKTIEETPEVWLSNCSITIVTLAALKYGKGPNLKKAFQAITLYISDPLSMIKEDDKTYLPIEHSGVHFLLKKLIQFDRERDPEDCFSSVLVSSLEETTFQWWIRYNRGCFLIVKLIELGVETVQAKIKQMFSSKTKQLLKAQQSTGAAILRKKLDEI